MHLYDGSLARSAGPLSMATGRERLSRQIVWRGIVAGPEYRHERLDLYRRLDRGDPVYSVIFGPSLRGSAVQSSERVTTTPVEVRSDFVHWTPVIAGALVASALSLVLITFGTSLGLSVASTAPTWRDASRVLALISGLYLVLTAAVSFGFGGYVGGRLRRTWEPGLHHDFVERSEEHTSELQSRVDTS